MDNDDDGRKQKVQKNASMRKERVETKRREYINKMEKEKMDMLDSGSLQRLFCVVAQCGHLLHCLTLLKQK